MREKLRGFLGQSRFSVLPSKRSRACRRESPAGGVRSGVILTSAATALVLSACAQPVEPKNPLQNAMDTTPTNSVFERHLYADYLVQAVAESGGRRKQAGRSGACRRYTGAPDEPRRTAPKPRALGLGA
jgi:hypothetical protein